MLSVLKSNPPLGLVVRKSRNYLLIQLVTSRPASEQAEGRAYTTPDATRAHRELRSGILA